MGDDVPSPEQGPVQGLAAQDQGVPVRGGHDQIHQRVDGRVADAAVVARARGVRGHRMPERALLVARGQGLGEAGHDHVEIKGAQAFEVLGRVHHAHGHGDAQARQVALKGQDHALEIRLNQEHLESEGLPVPDQLAAAHGPARLLEQGRGLAQVAADVAAAVGDGQAEGLGIHLGGQAKRLQDGPLLRGGLARRRHLGIGEKAFGARVLPVEQVFVAPFEIESVVEGLSHQRVGEHGAACVEGEALHALGQLVRDILGADQAGLHGRPGVTRGPLLGVVLLAIVVFPGLEGFQGHGQVAVIIIDDGVEIVPPRVHGQVAPPVVGIALVGQALACHELADAVRAAAHGDVQGRGAKILPGPGLFGQDRQLPQDEGEFLARVRLEMKGDDQGALDLDPLHVGIVLGIVRVALLDEHPEGEGHVRRGDGAFVVKPGVLPQVEGHGRTVRGQFHALGQQAVFREGLVQGLHRQGVEDEAQAVGGISLDDEGVEAVEGADGRQPDLAALDGGRVRVFEMREVRTVFGAVVHGQGMDAFPRRGGHGGEEKKNQDDEALHGVPARVWGFAHL